ncbi:hypothetical protein EYC84_004010 [Monilinia fructicola]|uniref:DUF202 domain-containing protein n=1 Tax=Monilinia fructicola TaxID=38448 RepID=A0A5M9JZT2_MONFR|nr:hypothetical protein EYC84_004010 [Monilinia fructicola]
MAETSQHHQSIEESEERPNVSPAERDQWESTELSVLAHTRQNYTRASSSHALGPGSTAPTGFIGQFTYSISKFWRHQISVTVDHVTCRDHLGPKYFYQPRLSFHLLKFSADIRFSLERTFLAYLRTSLTLSMLGVSIAQLFRLQHSPTPNRLIGFFVLGKPLACICQVAAITTLLIGAIRSWRHQNAIVRGKALFGGFDVIAIGGGLFCILLTFLILLIAVDVTKEDSNSNR